MCTACIVRGKEELTRFYFGNRFPLLVREKEDLAEKKLIFSRNSGNGDIQYNLIY